MHNLQSRESIMNQIRHGQFPQRVVTRQCAADGAAEAPRPTADFRSSADWPGSKLAVSPCAGRVVGRHEQAQRDIAILSGVISHIRHIPSEILAEIFKFCAAEQRVSLISNYSIDNPRLFPVVLTHVCSRWRDVAINTPRLWDCLELCFPPQSPRRTGDLLADLGHRSHTHGLTVKIKWHTNFDQNGHSSTSSPR